MPWPRPSVVTALIALALGTIAFTTACTTASGPSATTPSTTTATTPAITTPATTPSAPSPATISPAPATATSPASTAGDSGSAAPTPTPTAQAVGLEPQVGPLFATGDSQPHGCSASVVHSPGHDLVITAAHCVSGTGAGELFAPDYRDGTEPFGAWRVLRAWASPGWVAKTDPDLDVAVLQLGPRRVNGRLTQIEDVVGAETLGTTPSPGAEVTVVGYTHGINDRQITCTNVLSRSDEFPSFSCHGYLGGTSGSPFLTDARPREIVGLVGGRDLGGCTEAVSYSPPFGPAVAALLTRAAAGAAADSLPTASGDC